MRGTPSSTMVLGLALFCAAFFSWSCVKETEQDRAKKVITSIQTAAEEKDINGIMKRLSRSYADQQGQTYDTVKGFLLGYFFRYQKVSVYVTDLDVAVRNDAATANLQAVLSGRLTGMPADVVPDSLGMYSFQVELRKESGEWLVLSARWERVGEGRGER